MANHKKKTGLYFGSYNPVHVGHLALANFIAENLHLDEIWFVVSPHNPFKDSSVLIEAEHRINMLNIATNDYPKFKVCDIELQLPKPSYTYKTIIEINRQYPDLDLSIIMGSDNVINIDKWKNIDDIMAQCQIIVYPRPGYIVNKEELSENFLFIEAPVFDIDSTLIRKGLSEDKDYRFLLPCSVYKYIKENNLF